MGFHTGPPKILSKISPATGTEEEQPEGVSSNSSASITEAKTDTEPLPEPQDIWEEAYHQVKNDESLASIVDEFEATILSKLQSLNADHDGHNGATSTSLIGQIANLDPNSRQNLMKRLVNNDDDRPNRSKTVSQISIVFESAKKTINSVLDVYPPASMAWAGVCVVLTPVFNHTMELEENRKGLIYIISRLPWYMYLIDLLRSDAWRSQEEHQKFKIPIRTEIVNLYRLVIEYQMLTFRSCHHRTRDFARNTVGLAEWEDRLQGIQSAEKHVEKFVHHDHMTQVLVNLNEIMKQSENNGAACNKHRDFVEKQDRLSKQNKLIQDFKPNPNQHDYQAYRDYLDHIERPLAETNNGVRNHPRFKRWESGEDRLLLLVATPGMGKSVFTKSLLEDLSKSVPEDPSKPNPPTVCSFFFKDKSGQQNKVNVALCKILYELFLARENLVAGVQEMVKPLDKEDTRLNVDKLWDIFETATQSAARDSIIVLLDALDEVDREQGTKLLERLRQFSSQSVKIILTTRPIQPVLDIFHQQKEFILDLNDDPKCSQSLCDDITKVAENKLETFCRHKKIERENIKAELHDQLEQHIQDDRTYLFVGLLFDYLNKQPTQRLPRKWIDTFKSLPTTVFDAYRALLDNIQKDHRSDVKTMLQIVLSAQRPLTVGEMNIALNISTIDVVHSTEDMDLMLVEDFKAWILETCHFFLVTYDNRIHFIHQTVRDFLLPKLQEDERPEWLADNFSEESCHQALIKSCIKYISAPFNQTPPAVNSLEQFFNAPLYTQLEIHGWFMERNEFDEYAFTQWFVHLDFIRKHENKEWLDILGAIQRQYISIPFDLAEFVFCCSSFPSEKEVELFRTMPSIGSGDRDLALSCLAQGLDTRYLRTSLFSELCYAIGLAEEVINRTYTNDQKLGRRLVDLSRAYLHQDVESSKCCVGFALESAERAIQVTSRDHVDWSSALAARASALIMQFLYNKNDDDLNQAIDDMEAALNPMSYSLSDQGKAGFLQSYAKSLGYRYIFKPGESRRGSDLERAIEAAQHAVDGISHRNPRRATVLHTLGNFLGVRAYDTEKKEHIDQAIDVYRMALEHAPPTGTERVDILQGFASRLLLRYRREGSKDDLQEALDISRQSINVIPEYHCHYFRCLDQYEKIQKLALSEKLEHRDCEDGYV